MAGTVTTSEVLFSTVRKLTFAWTSAADGSADATTTAAFDGKLLAVTTIPSGVAAPSADYDVVLTDADGHDVLLGSGANRSDTLTEHVAEASLGFVAGSKLTLAVTNAGNAKSGTVVVWLR